MDLDVITNWIGGILLTAIVVGAPTACSVHSNNLKAQAIANGSDPIAADCAYSTSPNSIACALAAARLQQAKSKE